MSRHRALMMNRQNLVTRPPLRVVITEDGDDGSHVDECDPDPEIRYWNSVRSYENPVAIGLVMAGRLKREKGVSINLQYPDYDAIIDTIRRQREQQGSLRNSGGGGSQVKYDRNCSGLLSSTRDYKGLDEK